jgi:hypothetical protein
VMTAVGRVKRQALDVHGASIGRPDRRQFRCAGYRSGTGRGCGRRPGRYFGPSGRGRRTCCYPNSHAR